MREPISRSRPRSPRVTFGSSTRDRIEAVLQSGKLNQWYGGPAVKAFELAFAAKFGRRHAVACNSGTSALHLVYSALELEPGSEVLIPANAYVSAASAALQCDLIPTLVDIDPATWSMDAYDAERKVTPRTRAILVVPMYGQPCDMDRLMTLAQRKGLQLIEDGAAAHGATWHGRPVGSWGVASCFSVCCFKVVTAGEGGVVATDEAELAATVRSLAHKGKGNGFFEYIRPGYSYHMSEVSAAIAHASLADMDDEISRRTENAQVLRDELPGLGIAVQPLVPETTHGLFKLPVMLGAEWPMDVEEAVACLAAEGVSLTPAHPYLADIEWLLRREHPAFTRAGLAGTRYDHASCPVAALVQPRQMTIDVGPGLDIEDMQLVVQCFQRVHEFPTRRA